MNICKRAFSSLHRFTIAEKYFTNVENANRNFLNLKTNATSSQIFSIISASRAANAELKRESLNAIWNINIRLQNIELLEEKSQFSVISKEKLEALEDLENIEKSVERSTKLICFGKKQSSFSIFSAPPDEPTLSNSEGQRLHYENIKKICRLIETLKNSKNIQPTELEKIRLEYRELHKISKNLLLELLWNAYIMDADFEALIDSSESLSGINKEDVDFLENAKKTQEYYLHGTQEAILNFMKGYISFKSMLTQG